MHPDLETIELTEPLDTLLQVVPDSYAQYRPVLSDALSDFVRSLPVVRQSELITDQLRLPADATPGMRLVALMRSCPTLHKLGQVVARHPSLERSIRNELQQLESLDPQTTSTAARALVSRSLPALDQCGLLWDDRVLAEGSVAIVIGFRTCNDIPELPERGVMKILKPGVDSLIEEELALWSHVGSRLDESAARRGLPPLHYRETFDQVCDLLRNEVRFDREQANLIEAARSFENEQGIRVPRLFPFCSPTITTMERIDGRPLSYASRHSDYDAALLVKRLVRALIVGPVFDPNPQSLFHADPHPGNLLLADDGDLVVIDWSLVGRLSQAARTEMVQLWLGGWTGQRDRMLRAIEILAEVPFDHSAVAEVVDRAIHGASVRLAGLSWMIDLLDELAVRAGVRFDKNLLIFRKSLLTLKSVFCDLCPETNVDLELGRAVSQELFTEWPERVWSSPFSRDYGTRLSNADLLALWGRWPTIAGAVWSESWRSMMAPKS